MSKIFISIFAILLISTIVSTLADDAHCEFKGIKFKKGETITRPGECVEATCDDPAHNAFSGIGCAASQPGPGCHESAEDLTKPYPQCCPKTICT